MADIKPDNPPATGKVSRRTFLRLFGLGIISSTLVTTGAAALLSRKDSLADTSNVFAEFTALQKEEGNMQAFQMLANVIVNKIHLNPSPDISEVVYISLENGTYRNNQNCSFYYTKYLNIENNIFEDCYCTNSNGVNTNIPVGDFPKFITTEDTTIRVIISKNEQKTGKLVLSEDLEVAIYTNKQSVARTNTTHLSINATDSSGTNIHLDLEENIIEQQINGRFKQQIIEYTFDNNVDVSKDGYIKYDSKGNVISSSNNGNEHLYKDDFFMLQSAYEGTSLS
ncbi:MAG TPA: hypothetical protein VG895_01090 [Patescibacteria group bacterium]|nr:hypothetical protein [Patescibacteria group bacterium]